MLFEGIDMSRMMICGDGRCRHVLDGSILGTSILVGCTGGLGLLCMLQMVYLG